MTELRGRTRLADYGGLASARPAAALVLTLSLLSLVGIPPLAGFRRQAPAVRGRDRRGLRLARRRGRREHGRPLPVPVAVLGRSARIALWLSGGAIGALGLGANAWLARLGDAAVLVP